MKILKHKKEPILWKENFICSDCEAELLVEFQDLYKVEGDYSYNYEFTCPECGDERIFLRAFHTIYSDRYIRKHESEIPMKKDHPLYNPETQKIQYLKEILE